MFLFKEKNKIFLEDNNSKFGTLILTQYPQLDLCENLPLKIQVGKIYFNILVKIKKSFFSCCNCSVNAIQYFYILQSHNNINYSNSIIIKDNIIMNKFVLMIVKKMKYKK